MLTLRDLLNSPDGRQFLESRGVFVDKREFRGRLNVPALPGLAQDLGLGGGKLVCSGQQLYVDYRQSVLSKILTMQELDLGGDLTSFFLWVDTDRSGSDNLITKFAWPTDSKKGAIRIAPPATNDIEARFVQLEPSQLRSAIDKLGTHLRQSGVSKKGAKQRYLQLRDLFVRERVGSLTEFNQQLTDFLLESHLGYTPRSLLLSDLLSQEIFAAEVGLFLNQLEEVIRVFNEAIGSLIQAGIDPQVTPLETDYLPLFYSCDNDYRRLRLLHHVDGGVHFAVGSCKCGRNYKVYLGRKELTLAQLAQTKRWSPDVCLPIFLNDLVSGFVAGKSSALYLLVMSAVMSRVLGKQPVPVLVPQSLGKPAGSNTVPDSLLYRYLSAEHNR